jgi:hypothetical protein
VVGFQEFLAVFKGSNITINTSDRTAHCQRQLNDAIDAPAINPECSAPKATIVSAINAPRVSIGLARGRPPNPSESNPIPKVPKVHIVLSNRAQATSSPATPATRSSEKAPVTPATQPQIKSAVQAPAKYKREARGRGVSKKTLLICLASKKPKSKCKGDCCNPFHYTGPGGHKHCKSSRKRKALCSCENCGGAFLCKHGRQKHKCTECGGHSMCSHGDQKSRCKKCYEETGVLHGSMCVHGTMIFEKWRCKLCNC